ncbi:hypothetical protein GQ43DRAFT_461156 [Delitschia confertaspora ATCC 74209]|uniref:Uncharacterized protein n=1 Tax=Delitschia confertaspora ATCC 74209 TaxID=1513339 RepID=A0A9P4JQN4_9PLEO|nr:hypothetical protein GQ43DRAFT_461156 [Delitschia confertaspora ATCC 74209]
MGYLNLNPLHLPLTRPHRYSNQSSDPENPLIQLSDWSPVSLEPPPDYQYRNNGYDGRKRNGGGQIDTGGAEWSGKWVALGILYLVIVVGSVAAFMWPPFMPNMEGAFVERNRTADETLPKRSMLRTSAWVEESWSGSTDPAVAGRSIPRAHDMVKEGTWPTPHPGSLAARAIERIPAMIPPHHPLPSHPTFHSLQSKDEHKPQPMYEHLPTPVIIPPHSLNRDVGAKGIFVNHNTVTTLTDAEGEFMSQFAEFLRKKGYYKRGFCVERGRNLKCVKWVAQEDLIFRERDEEEGDEDGKGLEERAKLVTRVAEEDAGVTKMTTTATMTMRTAGMQKSEEGATMAHIPPSTTWIHHLPAIVLSTHEFPSSGLRKRTLEKKASDHSNNILPPPPGFTPTGLDTPEWVWEALQEQERKMFLGEDFPTGFPVQENQRTDTKAKTDQAWSQPSTVTSDVQTTSAPPGSYHVWKEAQAEKDMWTKIMTVPPALGVTEKWGGLLGKRREGTGSTLNWGVIVKKRNGEAQGRGGEKVEEAVTGQEQWSAERSDMYLSFFDPDSDTEKRNNNIRTWSTISTSMPTSSSFRSPSRPP